MKCRIERHCIKCCPTIYKIQDLNDRKCVRCREDGHDMECCELRYKKLFRRSVAPISVIGEDRESQKIHNFTYKNDLEIQTKYFMRMQELRLKWEQKSLKYDQKKNFKELCLFIPNMINDMYPDLYKEVNSSLA